MLTPKFRVNWPVLFQARPKDPNDATSDKEYSVSALFPAGADFSEMKAAAHEAAAKKWGVDPAKWPTGLKSPFRDQGEFAKAGVLPDGYVAGSTFMKFKSSATPRPNSILPPGVLAADAETPITEPHKVYAGVWARADVTPFAYDVKGNKGITFFLNTRKVACIQIVADGEPLKGSIDPTGAFKPIAGAAPGAAAGVPATSLFG